MHASEFSSHDISFYNYWAFLKTRINLRNLPPAHSRGAMTFSGLGSKYIYVHHSQTETCSNECSLYSGTLEHFFIEGAGASAKLLLGVGVGGEE